MKMNRYCVYLPSGTVEVYANKKELTYDGRRIVFIRIDKDQDTVVAEFYTDSLYGWGLMG